MSVLFTAVFPAHCLLKNKVFCKRDLSIVVTIQTTQRRTKKNIKLTPNSTPKR